MNYSVMNGCYLPTVDAKTLNCFTVLAKVKNTQLIYALSIAQLLLSVEPKPLTVKKRTVFGAARLSENVKKSSTKELHGCFK